MIKRIAVAFFAMFLVSGCSYNKKGGDNYVNDSKHLAEFEKEVGDRVFFALDSCELSSEAQGTITRQAEWLKNHELFNITVEGHCDERGTKEYNIALGERRAESVKSFLVKQGVNSTRIDTVSYGKERPAVIGNDEAAWSQNRRGVVSIR
jgi:peptidoglycan-associated lipoprotein